MNTDLFSYASSLCSRKEYCRSEIESKLKIKGATSQEVNQLIEQLEREGYIDEMRYAHAFVRDKFRFEHWGRVKIRYQLLRKGICDCDIDDALNEIDEKQYRDALSNFIQARQINSSEDDSLRASQKIARVAINRGYEPPLVFKALNI